MLEQEEDLLAQRRAGVLLHITSLPNDHGSGTLSISCIPQVLKFGKRCL